jgi:hypothetical protein
VVLFHATRESEASRQEFEGENYYKKYLTERLKKKRMKKDEKKN